MALGALTLSTTSGVQGRRFQANINGMTTGRVEVLNDGSPGFSTVNGKVRSHGLPYAANTVVLREYEPGVGAGYRDTRIDITATTKEQIAAQATASLGVGRTLKRVSVNGTVQSDGSLTYAAYVEDDLGAMTISQLGVTPTTILATATAFWDFNQASAPFTPAIGPVSLALVDGVGSTVTKSAGGPFGSAVSFDGSTDYLIIPAANVGVLNMATKQAVSVVGWVQRTAINQANFIAGMWQEDNTDPKRQYGLFVDLPSYGGDNQVCGHVSKTGGATPGYPFSRDYSATGQELPSGEWAMVAFTYDGAKITSYYDGAYDVRPTFTDNQSQSYAKNPYLFADGLNTTAVADFTVGAVKLTAGFNNWMKGLIGGVAVFDRALTPAEMTKLRKQTLMAGEPVYYWSMYKETTTQVPAETQGWKSAATTAATPSSTNNTLGNWNFVGATAERFFYRSGTNATDNLANRTTPGIGYLDTMDGLLASEIASISVECNNSLAADTFRIVARFGSTWYATDASYSVTGDGRTGSVWTTSETKTLTGLLTAGKWRALSFVPGSDLTLGATIAGSIPDGPLTGIGFYSPLVNGVVRVRNLKVFAA